MPNIKDLFKQHDSSGKVLSAKNINELTSSHDAESFGYIEAYKAEKDRFFPEVDFSKPETFVKYGSAEKYYEDSISRIYRMYPYDGSHKEKIEWHNSSSYFDNYIFDNEYPRTNGYLTIPPFNGGLSKSVINNPGTGNETYTLATSPQYISVKGGPNKAGVADSLDQSDGQTFSKASSKSSYTETSANIYDAEKRKVSNLAIDGVYGNTIEFWSFAGGNLTTNKAFFDAWNDDGTTATAIKSASYGRMLLESRFQTSTFNFPDNAPFHFTYMSGTSGAERVPLFVGNTPALQTWNHYAISVKNDGNQLRIKTYKDGELIDNILTGSSISEVTGAINANIAAYRTFPTLAVSASANTAGVTDFTGFSQPTASIDEFRFWKTARTSQDIGRNWFTQVYGGTNTDDANTDLGIYFKFNEGITDNVAFDAVALDYSGRISNGQIQNYLPAMRQTGSAMVEAGAASSEFLDPVIYSFHPQVVSLLSDKKGEGEVYDVTNPSSIYNTFPNWITENDIDIGGGHLKNLVQIISNYFDTLQLQVDHLPRMKDAQYTKYMELQAQNYADGGNILLTGSDSHPAYSSSYSGKPQPFIKSALQSLGIEIPELFTDADALEQLSSRDEDREYKDKLYNVKNQIYQNIYNNLSFILKSKGTEKSFRNLVRCFGVDDELVRLNLYGNNVDFELRNNFRSTAVKKTYVDFMDVDRQGATVYMMTSSVNDNTNAYSYIESNSNLISGGFGMTFQTEVYFPNKGEEGDPFYQPFEQLSSSLYGMHTAVEAAAGSSGQANTTWNDPDVSEFKVYAVRPESRSPHAYFQLTSSVLGINLTSSVFDFVYDNEKWNFSVRIKPTKYPWANALTGTNSASLASGIAADEDLSYEVSFYGAHADLDIIVDEFDLSATISASLGDNFMSGSKRLYIGAHRTNFTGGLLQESDVRISSTRAWMDYLTNDELRAQAKDAESKGVLHPYKNAFVFQDSVKDYDIPRSDLLIFEWDFTNVTSSDGGISGIPTTYDARFVVEDISSGSTSQNFADWITDNRYGSLRFIRNQYTGRGDFFEPNNDQVVDHIYINSAKLDAPEVINSSDMIEILNQDDLEFTRDSRPIDYFYAVEKSMYQTISDEMLRMFATIADFNNLIGEPVNRYRGRYKDMDKLKSLFFERIGNSPDLDKYVEFYKWIDASITKFLEQLFPASANYADSLRTVVENHVLERSAYRNKFPTLEVKQKDPEVSMLGIRELKYNWKFGHAPTDVSTDTAQQNNCLWFNQRAERTVPALSSSVASVNADKQTILDIATTDNSGSYLDRYQGSTYALRKLSRPYKEGVSFSKQFHGGVNFDENKKVDYWKGILNKRDSENSLLIRLSPLQVDDSGKEDKHCADAKDKNPLDKNKLKTDVWSDGNDDGALGPYEVKKSNTVLPFNLYTLKATTDTDIDTTDSSVFSARSYVNIHHDGYGHLGEIPMQGPFSEKWEGGNQHRHIRVNDGRDITTNSLLHRPEAWGYASSNTRLMNQIDAKGPNATVAPYYRDFIAKRPLVIKNILQTTASVDVRLDGAITHGPIGNYSAQHNVVQTSGRSQNNKYFVEQQGVGFGKVFGDLEASPQAAFYNREYVFPTPERKTTDAVFVERFSAPGSYEAISRGYLDPFAEEKSAYNAMPFRNLTVRGDKFRKFGVQRAGFTFVSNTASNYNNQTLIIVDQVIKKSITYIFVNSGTTGDLDGSGRVKVLITGSDRSAYVDQLIAAINSANGHNAGVADSLIRARNRSSVYGNVGFLLVESLTSSLSLPFATVSIPPEAAQVEMSASIWSTSSLGLRSLLSRHTIFGGYDYEAQSDGAFHKTYRNRRRRTALADGVSYIAPNGTKNDSFGSDVVLVDKYDNAYITHAIPRSDSQYSWYFNTQPNLTTRPSTTWDLGYFPYSGEASSSSGGFASFINIPSADHSNFGAYYDAIFQIWLYGRPEGTATGFQWIPVDYVGLNTIFVPNSTQLTGNTISLELVPWMGLATQPPPVNGLPVVLNGGLLNMNGPYGHPTFKQVRNMYHPVARYLKNTNTYSISVRDPKPFISDPSVLGNSTTIFNQTVFPKLNYRNLTDNSYEGLKGQPHGMLGAELTIENYIEPPLSSKYKPLRHELTVINDKNEIADLRIDHTYANNYDYFANPTLMNKMNYAGVIQEPGRQVYDNLLEYTVKGTVPADSNPIKGFKNLIYKETIYPKEQHTFLAKSRGRTLYTEEVGKQSYTLPLGEQRTFWKDKISLRQRLYDYARNPFDYTIPVQDIVSVSPDIPSDFPAYDDLSIWPLDVGDRSGLADSTYDWITGSNHGHLTTYVFQQQVMELGISGARHEVRPNASYEYHNIISSSGPDAGANMLSEFIPNWDTARLSNKKPWFDSYEEYAEDIRTFGKDYTVLPEYKISDHIEYYLEKGSFLSETNNFLKLEGGYLSQSAASELAEFDDEFYNVYSHTDFLKHFEVISNQHEGVAKQTEITVKCHGIKKLLPYNGFYPATRTVQLASLLSQSFAPYLSGSEYTINPAAGGSGATNGQGAVVAERLSAFMQPFMAPGILYNSIKSGIAVDWMAFSASVTPVTTKAQFSDDDQLIFQHSSSFRIPFEAVIEPQNYLPSLGSNSNSDETDRLYYLDTRYHSASSDTRVSKVYSIWTGENTDHYSLAMNNFMAEVPNFFLEGNKMSSIESQPVATFMSGVSYYMDLDLYMTDDTVMYEGPSRVSGSVLTTLAPSLRGMHYGPCIGYASSSLRQGLDAKRQDPAFAPWTPPYFYGKSTVRFEFAPHKFTDLLEGELIDIGGSGASSFSMDELVSYIATSGTTFFNNFDKTGGEPLQLGLTDPTKTFSPIDNVKEGFLATRHQMQLNASMNLFSVENKTDFTYDPKTGQKVLTDEKTRRWVITPKFECPVLDFSGNIGSVFTDKAYETRGMWRGYGDLPSSGQGLHYNIRDSFPNKMPPLALGNPVLGIEASPTANITTGSLRQKLFSNSSPVRVGDIAAEKEIREAVVAIPFTVNGNKKVFFPFVPAKDSVVAKSLGRQVVNNILGTGEEVNPEVFVPGQSLIDQVQKMQRYVFPPRLDFINNETISPFQMYIFEFNHILDKQDLADIWQGVMPKISTKAEKQTTEISHFLTNNELLLGRDVTREIRWMVFKVKQKAENSYQKLLAKSKGTDKFTDNNFGEQTYSYNWPYDFFSLVELAKIETSVQIGGNKPVTPPDIEKPVLQNEIEETPKKGGPPLVVGEDLTTTI